MAGYNFQENLFESVIEPTIKSLKQDIETHKRDIAHISGVLEARLPGKDDFIFNSEGWRIFREFTAVRNQQEAAKDELMALNQVRVIYLFKNLEISLRGLIKAAYRNLNTKDLFKWESMISFFKQKNIDIQGINGYAEVDELRRLNNNLKHSEKLEGDVLNIREFKLKDEVDQNDQIDRFVARILPKVMDFQQALIEEVRKELYDFSEEKLGKMVEELFKRMPKQVAESFILKLKERYKL